MKRWVLVLLLSIITTVVHLLCGFFPFSEQFEMLSMDLWGAIRGRAEAPKSVAVVALDEQSFGNLNVPMNQAWPRSLHAELLQKLNEYGAKKVVFDILFIGGGSDPKGDKDFESSIKTMPVVLGADVGSREQTSSTGQYSYEEILEPYPKFRDAAEEIALVRLPEDRGYVRRFRGVRSLATENIPTLYEAAASVKPSDVGTPSERDLISYYGPPGTIEIFPYHQVLNPPKNKFPPETFKDKVVFVGLILRTELGVGVKDAFRASLFHPSDMFGVEIHATATANLIEHHWIKRLSKWLEITLLLLATLVISIGIFALRPIWAGLLFIAAAVFWSIAAYVSFLGGFFLPGATLVGIILPLAFLGSTLGFYVVTRKSQQQVEKAFQYYLSPEMAKEMSKNKKGLSLGGESVFGTALFTDIVGFSEVTEKMLASEVSTMLNAYFTEVMDVIFENKGTLIKFIGDAVFVIWGAPIKVDDHARLACKTALAIQEGVKKFNASRRFPPLFTRVGINTGPMVVGNLGSAKRFDYTAIGDTVNLCSRLEGLNKYLGTPVLISDATKKELGSSSFAPFYLGLIGVAGKKECVGVNALFEESFASSVQEQWNLALNDFRARRWDDAESKFSELSKDPKLEKASKLYITRAKTFRTSPPDDVWQGEITFDQK